jgi:hypothetical protein
MPAPPALRWEQSCAPYDGTGRLHSVTAEALHGRVFIVAGEHPALLAVAATAHAAGALVAVASLSLNDTDAAVRFRSDAADPATWDRVLMHVEQHLGPVDGAATDEGCHDVVRQLLVPDLHRRGHGEVVVVTAEDDPRDVLRRMTGTRRATPPRPPGAGESP